MVDVIEDEAPLPSLEEFLDDLDVSIGELSIDGKCTDCMPVCFALEWHFLRKKSCCVFYY